MRTVLAKLQKTALQLQQLADILFGLRSDAGTSNCFEDLAGEPNSGCHPSSGGRYPQSLHDRLRHNRESSRCTCIPWMLSFDQRTKHLLHLYQQPVHCPPPYQPQPLHNTSHQDNTLMAIGCMAMSHPTSYPANTQRFTSLVTAPVPVTLPMGITHGHSCGGYLVSWGGGATPSPKGFVFGTDPRSCDVLLGFRIHQIFLLEIYYS